jgi:hypothetical protein
MKLARLAAAVGVSASFVVACDDGGSSHAANTGGGSTGTGSPPATSGTSMGTAAGPSTGSTTGAGGQGEGGSGGGGTPTIDCSNGCSYVRGDAAPGGDGTDWASALSELPSDLVRGHTYVIGAGTYSGYDFDDAPDGDSVIRIVRATSGDHGTDSGWEPSFGEGEATFGTLQMSEPFYEIDGRGTTRAVGDFQSTVVSIDASSITLRGIDVDGAFAMNGGEHSEGACTGMTVNGDDVVVENTRIHDAADDGLVVSGSNNFTFSGNRIHAMHGCGTDGGCGPCYNGHSDGVELYDVTSSSFIGNMIWDVASTSTFFFGNWADTLGNGPSEYCEDILIANNILYGPETGFVAYITDVAGIQLYNNVIWGRRQGAYGGLSIGPDITGLDMVNNVILSINLAHTGGTFDASEFVGMYNVFGASTGQWEEDATDQIIEDPGFTAIPGANGATVANPDAQAFAPTATSPLRDAGMPASAEHPIPQADFFGTARDATPNVGAIE